MLPLTWGKAWITVSNRDLIPVAIFNSFSTETLQCVNSYQPHIISVSSRSCVSLRVCHCVCALTSRYPQDSHDAYDGGVYGEGSVQVYFLKSDPHDRQEHDGEVQLVPSWHTHTHMFSISLRIKAACMFVSLYSCESSNTSLWKTGAGRKRWAWESTRWQKPPWRRNCSTSGSPRSTAGHGHTHLNNTL